MPVHAKRKTFGLILIGLIHNRRQLIAVSPFIAARSHPCFDRQFVAYRNSVTRVYFNII
ncbi:hypothetical protein D3C80_1937020 [compost metagenome]